MVVKEVCRNGDKEDKKDYDRPVHRSRILVCRKDSFIMTDLFIVVGYLFVAKIVLLFYNNNIFDVTMVLLYSKTFQNLF